MKTNKTVRVILIVLFAVLMGNLIRTGGLSDIRVVDFLQILAAGALLGVIITLLFSRPKQ
jgi:hypothetical protein